MTSIHPAARFHWDHASHPGSHPLLSATTGNRWSGCEVTARLSDLELSTFTWWLRILTTRLVDGGRITIIVEP